MRKLLLWILGTGIALATEATVTRYDVHLSLFGKVGEATVSIAIEGDRYVMIVEDHATGMAAKISDNEHDRFVSEGHILDGRYISDRFTEYQKSARVSEINVYTFDHDEKKITRYQDKNETVSTSTFDFMSMGVKTVEKVERKRKKEALKFYSETDALSVVLNFPRLSALAPQVGIKPVGLAKKDRRIYLRRPTEPLTEVLEDFDSSKVKKVVEITSIEVKDDDEYGIYIGYDGAWNIEEAVTKENYYLIGYGRIVKVWEKNVPVQKVFEHANDLL